MSNFKYDLHDFNHFRALLNEIITNLKNPHYSHTANIKVSFIDWLCINFGFIHNAVIHSVLLHMNWILWGGSSYPTQGFIVPHHWGTMNRLDLFVSNHYFIRMDISYKSETLPQNRQMTDVKYDTAKMSQGIVL